MSVLTSINSVSIDDAFKMVMQYGPTNTILFQGEPGIGKSSILSRLSETLSSEEYEFVYLDWSTTDLGDLFIRAPNRDTGELEFYPSSLFNTKSAKKKVIMIDELGKGDKMMQKMGMRLILEQVLGDYKLPTGSIVFATTNNSSDGVGDALLAHGGNRVMIVQVRKSNAKEWLTWATDNGVSALIRAWVAMNPRSLASYLDGGQDDNAMIFNPKNRVLSFVSPRSLAKCDPVIRAKSEMGDRLTHAALAGTIGAAAAESMAAFLSLEKELVSIATVMGDPEGVEIPEKPAALFMLMFNAIDTVETHDELSKFMRFVNRIKSSEIQAVFFTMLMQSKRTISLAKNNKQVMEWAKGNYELMI
jgi:nucleoside-triphosphatase THEP1